jgi:VanZ family protein
MRPPPMQPPIRPKGNRSAPERPSAGGATIILRWLPVVAWMGLIFLLSSQPSLPRAPDDLLDVLTKKGAHFGEYLLLAVLLSRALVAANGMSWPILALALGTTVAYAISDELHQSFVPGRTPSPGDVGIDAVGAITGLALFTGWRHHTLKRTLITSPSRTT